MTPEEIKALFATIDPLTMCGDPLLEGTLPAADGELKQYRLFENWNPVLANFCDEKWGVFNVQLMRHIGSLQLSQEDLISCLNNVQLDDNHWRWLNKSIRYKGDEYRWFFMVAEGRPQAACLIYHPKPSAINGQGIFYIEYVAVAPWNRVNPMAPREFKGVGTAMIRDVSEYAVSSLGLTPGFSLHALPKAVAFYKTIGMIAFPEYDKDDLPYFEMPEDACHKLGRTP